MQDQVAAAPQQLMLIIDASATREQEGCSRAAARTPTTGATMILGQKATCHIKTGRM